MSTKHYAMNDATALRCRCGWFTGQNGEHTFLDHLISQCRHGLYEAEQPCQLNPEERLERLIDVRQILDAATCEARNALAVAA